MTESAGQVSPGSMAPIGDAVIAYETCGAGRDMIWGHGLTQNRRLEDTSGLFDWSETEARLVRYDARGHGETTTTPDLAGYTWAALARDQLALADSLGIDHYVAGGASMGCATALHAAVVAPERIDALVLVIPPTGWETRAAQVETYLAGAAAIEQAGVEVVVQARAAIAPPDPLVDAPDYHQRQADGLRSWDPVRLATVFRGAAGADLPDRDQLKAISCPALILAWTGDPGHPASTAVELDQLMPHSALHLASTADQLASWPALVKEFIANRG